MEAPSKSVEGERVALRSVQSTAFQIASEAFRKIPPPFSGRIRDRKEVMAVMEKAKVELFRMEEQAKK